VECALLCLKMKFRIKKHHGNIIECLIWWICLINIVIWYIQQNVTPQDSDNSKWVTFCQCHSSEYHSFDYHSYHIILLIIILNISFFWLSFLSYHSFDYHSFDLSSFDYHFWLPIYKKIVVVHIKSNLLLKIFLKTFLP
jgi:hypothetical protein